jgi:transcriptional regulator with XRE-family HTH domain
LITRIKLKNAAARLRLKNKAASDLPPPDKIPVLIPQKAQEAISAEGAYEFTEAIEVPTEGTGGIYTAEYFRSLLDYLKQYPIAGSKDGHESLNNDFFTIGGELNEKDGVCYFRIRVPPEGWNSSNAALIRSLKAGIPELSIVADCEPERGNDGKVYFTKELGRPRNDLVPEGAMDQTIGNSMDEKAIMALIEQGAIDMDSESDTLVKNGKVFRKYAVNLQSASDKALAGRVLNAIAQKTKDANASAQNTKEKNGMNKDEVIQWLRNAIANNNLTVEDLVKELGMENKLRNATDEQRAQLVTAIAEILDIPPETPVGELVKAVTDAFAEVEAAAETVVNAAADELANGKKIKNAKGEDEDNPLYLYAKDRLKGLRGKQLNSMVEKLKTDPVMVALRSKQADTRVNAGTGDSSLVKPGNVIRKV